MTRRSPRVAAGLYAVVVALLGLGSAALMDAQAQGLVTMQKLSAPLATDLERVTIACMAYVWHTSGDETLLARPS